MMLSQENSFIPGWHFQVNRVRLWEAIQLFTNKNRSQSHQDAWHLEHTATQDLLEGQKKPRIEKNDPQSAKNGQML